MKQQLLPEEKIRECTAEVIAKAEEIGKQKDIILEKNKELTDSMHYAKRIQNSLLPSVRYIQRVLDQMNGKGRRGNQ